MIIRQAELKDIDTICALENACFKSGVWNKEQFLYEFNNNDYAYIYVVEEGKVFGYIDFWILFEQGTISKIAIAPNLQNKGVGNVLLKDAILRMFEQEVTSITLEVRVSNIKAINLYKKNGFKKLITKKGYYSDGEDAYLMCLEKGEVNG